MSTTLRAVQQVQVQSFWNLIQTIDEGVQKELYQLLRQKYTGTNQKVKSESPSFIQMQGILKGEGNEETDRQMLDSYMQEKYGV